MKYSQFAVVALAACATSVEARKRSRSRNSTPSNTAPPASQDSTDRPPTAVRVGETLGNVVNAGATVINKANGQGPDTTTSTRGFDDNSVLEARRGGGGHGGGGRGGGLQQFRRRQAIERALGAHRRSVDDDESLALRYFIEKIQARGLERRTHDATTHDSRPQAHHPQHHHRAPHHPAGNSTNTNTTEPATTQPTTHGNRHDHQTPGARRRSFDDDESLALRYLIEKIQARGLGRRTHDATTHDSQPQAHHPQHHHRVPHHPAGNPTSTNTTEPATTTPTTHGNRHDHQAPGARRRSLNMDDILVARYILKELKARSQARREAPPSRRSFEEQLDLRSFDDAVLNELD